MPAFGADIFCDVSACHKNNYTAIVDDASTDTTEQTARNFLNKHNCSFQILRHERNLGVSAARNTGLKAAKGRYIWFIDADDTADENFLSVMCAKAEEENADMVLCGYKIHDETKDNWKYRNIKLNKQLPSARDYFPAWMLWNIPSNIRMLYTNGKQIPSSLCGPDG